MKHSLKKLLSMALVLAMLMTILMPNAYAAATPNISKTKVTLTCGKSKYSAALKVSNVPSGGKVVWSVSNKKIAKVKKSKVTNTASTYQVTGLKKGKATVSAKVYNKKGKLVKTLKCAVTSKKDHNWKKVTSKKTVHHEAAGHYEKVIVGVKPHITQVVICRCKARFSTQAEYVAHKESYPVPYVGHNGFETIETPSGSTPIYEKQWVEDSKAWDETVTQVTYKCSCGAVK